MRISRKFGIIAGLLAGTAALPFLANKVDTPTTKPDSSPPAKAKMLRNGDQELIDSILNPKERYPDYRYQETKWAEIVYPTVRERVINLYKAEIEDLKGLKEGKITEKERKVKICLTDFVPPNEQGDDMGVGPKLHVIKYFDNKLPNGKFYRTYVNEHLPINEKTGALHPPDVMRVKVQAFGNGIEDLYKPSTDKQDTEMLLVSEMLKIAWGKKDSESDPFPYFARQHFYGDMILRKNQTLYYKLKRF